MKLAKPISLKEIRAFTTIEDAQGEPMFFYTKEGEKGIDSERLSIAQDILNCTSDIAFIIQNATFVNESDALRLKRVERKLETLEALLRAGSGGVVTPPSKEKK